MTITGILAAAVLAAGPTAAPDLAGAELLDLSREAEPAALVAERVRAVLRAPSQRAAWRELAGALPELAVRGGADIQSTFEAARLADEMAPPAPLPIQAVAVPTAARPVVAPLAGATTPAFGPTPAPVASIPDRVTNGPLRTLVVVAWGIPAALSEIDAEVALQLIALGLGFLALVMVLTGQSKTAPKRPRRVRARATRKVGGRCRDAYALAARGVPLYEIAQRTGLARDAVAVLLACSAA